VTTLKREVTTLKREKVALKAELARSKIELEQWQDLAKASIEAQEAGYQASSSSPSGNRENSSRAGRIPSVCNKSFDRGSSKPQQHESDNYKAMNKSKELQEDPEEASLRLIEQMLAEEAEEMVVMQEHQKRLQKEEEELKKRSEDDRKLAMELQNQWRSFECSICMEDKSLDDVFYTDQCDHPFCRKWYVIDLINSFKLLSLPTTPSSAVPFTACMTLNCLLVSRTMSIPGSCTSNFQSRAPAALTPKRRSRQ